MLLPYCENSNEESTVLNENFLDKDGNPLTGKGVVVGDVDSGIDIFHPMFFFRDARLTELAALGFVHPELWNLPPSCREGPAR